MKRIFNNEKFYTNGSNFTYIRIAELCMKVSWLTNLLFNKTVTLATILVFDTMKLTIPVKLSIVTVCFFF